MGVQRPLFVALLTILFSGALFSAIFVFSSLRSTRLSDADPVLQLMEPLSSLPRRLTGRSEARIREIFEAPAVDKEMPPLESFKLTKELIASKAKDNVIVVTFGNHAYMDLIMNWAKHLVANDVLNFIVGAMDVKLLEALYWKGIPVFDMGSGTDLLDLGWGTKAFHKLGRDKIYLLNSLLPFGFEVLLSDTDIVWLKNPLSYLAQFPEADILVSTDSVQPSSTDDYLDDWIKVPDSYNIGIFHWRPTESAVKFAKEWYESLVANAGLWDQVEFNKMLRDRMGPSVEEDEALVYAYNGSIKVGLLPSSIFCSGHTYFVQKLPLQLHLEAYAVHATFQFGGSDGKRHRLREAMLYYDPPEYFDSTGGFLSFKLRIPRHLLLEGPHTIESHFSLVNYQLKQIRTAFAIASLLNRTLVMPPMWCRLDRLWFGHPGVLPNTLTMQPFLCPMDHVLEPSMMLANLSEQLYGPRIEFKEHSFLGNPLLPKEIKDSRLYVRLCGERSANCNGTSPKMLRLPKNSDEDNFISIFSHYKHVKVLEFSSMDGVFKGFADREREKRFRRRVSRYTSIYCCVEHEKTGHIYYDIFWDEKPDWKPLPPKSKDDDRPKWVTD